MDNTSTAALDMSFKSSLNSLSTMEVAYQAAMAMYPPMGTPDAISKTSMSALGMTAGFPSPISAPMNQHQSSPLGKEIPCVELIDRHLWRSFHAYETEMVITKSGRLPPPPSTPPPLRLALIDVTEA
ncbi:hypothetical protein ACTXT7_005640 [Hymenolepis weldensis]